MSIYLATNQEHLRANYLMKTIGLNKHVDGIIYSAELGAGKPDPMFFNLAATRANVHSQEILLVDDNLANVDAAKTAGWNALHWTGELVVGKQIGRIGD